MMVLERMLPGSCARMRRLRPFRSPPGCHSKPSVLVGAMATPLRVRVMDALGVMMAGGGTDPPAMTNGSRTLYWGGKAGNTAVLSKDELLAVFNSGCKALTVTRLFSVL